MPSIPPIPYDRPQTSFEWIDWYTKLLNLVNSGAFNHNDLINIQGGNSTERYHLTQTQHAAVTTNLNETIDDRVAALVQNGTGITWSYNDGLNTLTPTVSLSSFSTTDLSEGTNLYFTNERVDDRVASLLVEGANIDLTYDDGANTLTVAVTGAELTANKNTASGYAGLNASSRTTKGVDTTDDVIIDLATKGLVLKDTQGTPHYWRVTIDNTGALVTTDLGTSKP